MFSLVGSINYEADSYTNVTLVFDETFYVPDGYTNVTLVFGEEEAIDPCDYTSGNWVIYFIDNCTITSNVDLEGNNISLHGDVGSFTLNASLINYTVLDIHDEAPFNILDGGSF